jgi:small subunit ribosomal protein S17
MTEKVSGAAPAAAHRPHEPVQPGEHAKRHGFRRTMTGRVVKAKMAKTVVVEVVSHSRDSLYGKYVRSRARYKAHDEKGEIKAGDEVEIQESRPLSRDKRWVVTRLVKKYVEE